MDIPPRIFSVLFFTVLMGRHTCKQITLTEIQIITNTEREGGGRGGREFLRANKDYAREQKTGEREEDRYILPALNP